jgi:FkbM family methyltransferase
MSYEIKKLPNGRLYLSGMINAGMEEGAFKEVSTVYDYWKLESDWTVADIGAFNGDYALTFVDQVSKIYSVEPAHIPYNALYTNIVLNKLIDKIVPIKAVLCDIDDLIEFYYDTKQPEASSVLKKISEDANRYLTKEIVLCLKWSTICMLYNIKNIDLMKIDAEGCESSILNGLELCRPKRIALASYHGIIFITDTNTMLETQLKKLSYRIVHKNRHTIFAESMI